MTAKAEFVRLNLGCGPQRIEGWVNVDSSPDEEPDVVADVCALPFEDESVDEIYASHILEHIPHDVPVLEEWHRVLAPGGTICVIVPDLVGTYYAWRAGLTWGSPTQYEIDLTYMNATVFGGVLLPNEYFHNTGHIHRQVFIFDMLVERMRPLFPDARQSHHFDLGALGRDANVAETMVVGRKP